PRTERMRNHLGCAVEHAQVAQVPPDRAAIDRARKLEPVQRFPTIGVDGNPVGETGRAFGAKRASGQQTRQAGKDRSSHFGFSMPSLGGTGERYPMTSISTPTPMNDTMRSTVPTFERSTRKSLTTTTPISAAPTIHNSRKALRVAKTMIASARIDQKRDNAACTRTECSMASSRKGTSAQWCKVRSSAPFPQMNAAPPKGHTAASGSY